MRLLTAGNGNDGIDLARGYLPDVILMDINLPGISGIEAMQILHLDPKTAHISIERDGGRRNRLASDGGIHE